MISLESEQKILEMAKLLREKKITIKEISVLADVNRTTAAMIIRIGRIRERNFSETKISHQKKKSSQQKTKSSEPPIPKGKPKKCDVCGRLVQHPCLACWLESYHRA